MELVCNSSSCRYVLSSEEVEMGRVSTKIKDGNVVIEVECPQCGHINKIYGKATKKAREGL